MGTSESQTLDEVVRDAFLSTRGKVPMTERALCQKFNVSRGKLRETLVHLEEQGLIRRQQKKGTYLRKPSIKEIVDLWDMRCGLEGVAARIACLRITDEKIKKLRQIIRKRSEAVKKGDVTASGQEDIRFHECIVEFSDNSFIRDVLNSYCLLLRIFKVAYPPSFQPPPDEQYPFGHDKIIEAFERRDPDLAEKAMVSHIQYGKKLNIEGLIGKIDIFD